jgi:purine-binding chemotaxis protein CheW
VTRSILVFALDDPHYAIPSAIVDRVIRAVEISPLPRAPRVVIGVINVQSRIIPVVDIRSLFHLPAREMEVGDQLIIARTPRRVMALVVDRVIGISEVPEEKVVSAESALPFAEYLQGVAKLEEGLLLIYDLDRFLSLDEEGQLDAALSGGDA